MFADNIGILVPLTFQAAFLGPYQNRPSPVRSNGRTNLRGFSIKSFLIVKKNLNGEIIFYYENGLKEIRNSASARG